MTTNYLAGVARAMVGFSRCADLFVAQKYPDYGRPERGYGFEYYNFYESLVHMGHGCHLLRHRCGTVGRATK